MLPPSEGKAVPSARRAPFELAALPYADRLTAVRERLIAAVDPALATAPAAPAAEVYTGVLYGQLDFGSLPAGARRRARTTVLIASGLWGLVGLADRIPGYKLPIDARVDGVGPLAALWRPAVAAALAERDSSRELVVDCRSGGYAAVWKPAHAARVEVRAFAVKPDGSRQVISHNAKATRGRVTRELLLAPRAPRRPADVLALFHAAGFDAELHAPAGRAGAPWQLDVLER
ncbi:peroxide stress protein YaaA [Conexibacter sp. JD483]|uniref:peroxide stress protein YaaA n=1 Tax=unclassified Conexibacter TaxID=2627773 RepID=UPI0027250DE2|nr:MULTISPECIES: peroxide stress protein YaaA [unclassified Conexibacter]MDO8188938.1 peroxide stress protein YaaA [Conexibacter sp. CPCC 205706]MDO8201688.1 peroxide stress protein YaaA [Conexibacter sp. CPCC 205762]MDR9371471.1 peroxide stress protein YaaA [Conexibacter sp. JD483]